MKVGPLLYFICKITKLLSSLTRPANVAYNFDNALRGVSTRFALNQLARMNTATATIAETLFALVQKDGADNFSRRVSFLCIMHFNG